MSRNNEGRPYSKGSDPAAAPAAKKKSVEQAMGKRQRANLRFRAAVLIEAEILRRRAAQEVGLSRRGAQDFLMRQYLNAPSGSFLKRLDPPAINTTYRLLRRVEALMDEGALEETTFSDGRRSGRPSKAFDPRVTDFLTKLILARPKGSVLYLQQEIEAFCTEKKCGEVPNKYDVRRFKLGFDVAELAAAAHGSRAAVTDALPKATIPTDFPHQIWTIDELEAPVFVKGYDHLQERMVSAKPTVVVIIDNHSRVIVNYYIPDPFAPGKGPGSYTDDDITGTFMGGVLPELAAPACRPYAGFIPHSVRLDCHSTHMELRQLGKDHNFDVPDLPGESPHHRGMVERLVGTLKGRCENMLGFEKFFVSADQVMANPKAARTAGAAKLNDRVTRRTVIAPDDLLNIEQFGVEFDTVVKQYHEELHSMLGTSPRAAYLTNVAPKRVRSGYDALCWTKPVSLTYQSQGVRHLGVRFVLSYSRGTIPIGTVLLCYPDRLMRGMYAEVPGPQGAKTRVFLMRIEAAARDVNPEGLAQSRNDVARAASDNAADIHVELLEDKVGVGAAERANSVLAKRLLERKGLKSERRKARNARAAERTERLAEMERAQADAATATSDGSVHGNASGHRTTSDTLSGKAKKAARVLTKPLDPPLIDASERAEEVAPPVAKGAEVAKGPRLKSGPRSSATPAPMGGPTLTLMPDDDEDLPYGMLTDFSARFRKTDGSTS